MTVDEPLELPGDVSLVIGEVTSVVTLVGDVDRVIGDDLERVRGDVAQNPRAVVVDTAAVTFMDSVGVAFLVQLAAAAAHRKDAPGTRVVLREPAECVLDLLQITGSLPLFDLVEETGRASAT